MAHCDISIRAQRDNCLINFVNEALLECEHGCPMHRPIEEAQMGHDMPLLSKIYSDPNCVNRIRIDTNNWKQSPQIWQRRFR